MQPLLYFFPFFKYVLFKDMNYHRLVKTPLCNLVINETWWMQATLRYRAYTAFCRTHQIIWEKRGTITAISFLANMLHMNPDMLRNIVRKRTISFKMLSSMLCRSKRNSMPTNSTQFRYLVCASGTLFTIQWIIYPLLS